jgi:hypothetical protein
MNPRVQLAHFGRVENRAVRYAYICLAYGGVVLYFAILPLPVSRCVRLLLEGCESLDFLALGWQRVKNLAWE